MSHARKVSEWLADHRDLWLGKVFPNGRWEKNYFLVGSINGDAGKSLRIPKRPNGEGLRDFANCWTGDDLKLLQEGLGLASVVEALREAERYGVPRDHLRREEPHFGERMARKKAKAEAKARTTATPNGAVIPPPPARHPELGEPTEVFEYRDDFHVYRWDLDPEPGEAKGGKEIRPVAFVDGQWRWTAPTPRPLFGLAELESPAPTIRLSWSRASENASTPATSTRRRCGSRSAAAPDRWSRTTSAR